MDANKIMRVIILTVILKVNGELEPKVTLTFVIDSTNSMRPVIDQVKDGVIRIFEAVVNSKQSPIGQYALVTFGDPDITTANITTEPKEFRHFIESISIKTGYDCPEMSVSGIKEALNKSLPGSYVYVFTDASAKDFDQLDNVKKMATEKQCQIIFFLTPKRDELCGKPSDSPGVTVYNDLSNATGGQVFYLKNTKTKNETNETLNYIAYSVTSRKIILTTGNYSKGGHNTSFIVDSRTPNMAISITGKNIIANLLGPDGKEVKFTNETRRELDKLLIFTVQETKRGTYNLTFRSTESSYLVVTGSSDVRFWHGFSTDSPHSLNDTHIKPISDMKNYLAIQLFGNDVNLTSVMFLSPGYERLTDIPLTLKYKIQQLYVTEPIYPLDIPFRIAVKGTDTNTNTEIIRYGYMVLESEKFTKPDVVINEITTIGYDESLDLECNVTAYPKPKIEWIDASNGNLLKSMMIPVDPPYMYSSILRLQRVKKDAHYQCKANNKLDSMTKDIEVRVTQTPHFEMLVRPANVTIELNGNAELHCEMNSSQPVETKWYPARYNNPKEYIYGTTLTITRARRSRKYICAVRNMITNDIVTFSAFAKVKYEAPVINKTINEVHVTEGKEAVLTCSILRGIPKPEINWYRWNITENKYNWLKSKKNKPTITVSLNTTNKEIYKCVAINGIYRDRAEHYVTLFIDGAPTIEKGVGEITIKEHKQLHLTCKVQGVPTPAVVWLKDGAPLRSGIQVNSDHSFQVTAKLSDEGIYTCNASNKHGYEIQTTQVNVTTLHIRSVPNVFLPKCGENINLTCIAEGQPKPTKKWIFYSFYDKVAKNLSDAKEDLIINNLKLIDRGYYTCVANNTDGQKNITYEVNVQCAPKIQHTKDNYEVEEGDKQLAIFCNATGNPKPDILWKDDKGFEPRYIASDDKKFYVGIGSDNGWLIIKNISIDDPTSYMCHATNGKKTVTKSFKVEMKRCPNAKIHELEISKGTTKKIKCDIPYNETSYHIWFKDQKRYHDGEFLEIHRANESYSGIYTCKVNNLNANYSDYYSIKLIVRSRLRFLIEPETEFGLEYGQKAVLNCEAEGLPKPMVYWSHNGNRILYSEMVKNATKGTETSEEYICTLDNGYESIRRSFTLKIKGCILKTDTVSNLQPLLTTINRRWPEYNVINGYTVIPIKEMILLSCSEGITTFNKNSVVALCEENTQLRIDGNMYNYNDIKCEKEFKAKEIETTGSGFCEKIIQHVFDNGDFSIVAYETCVRKFHRKEIPFFSKFNMISPAEISITDTSEEIILDSCSEQKRKFQRISMENDFAKSDCCFKKVLLVNPKDVSPGPFQRATYSKWNAVPHWSSCSTQNWDDVELRVRGLVKKVPNKDLIIYTGTERLITLNSHRKRNKNVRPKVKVKLGGEERPAYMYLWKVLQFPGNSSLAIIQVNGPKLNITNDKHCDDICDLVPWMQNTKWHDITRGYIFCCDLKNFIDMFKYPPTIFGNIEARMDFIL